MNTREVEREFGEPFKDVVTGFVDMKVSCRLAASQFCSGSGDIAGGVQGVF